MQARIARWGLVVLVTGWLLWMTLRPNESVAVGLSPLTTAASARGLSASILINLAGNIFVFAPLGFAIALALPGRSLVTRWTLSILGGASLSLAIELLQLTVPSRVSSWSDWLLNVAGTALGALVSGLLCRRESSSPGQPQAARLDERRN